MMENPVPLHDRVLTGAGVVSCVLLVIIVMWDTIAWACCGGL